MFLSNVPDRPDINNIVKLGSRPCPGQVQMTTRSLQTFLSENRLKSIYEVNFTSLVGSSKRLYENIFEHEQAKK